MATGNETKGDKPIAAGRAPDGLDGRSRGPYEAGLRDRAKISDVTVDPALPVSTGPSEGAGGGGNNLPLPAGSSAKPDR